MERVTSVSRRIDTLVTDALEFAANDVTFGLNIVKFGSK